MEIIEVKAQEYDSIFRDVPCFNKAAFNLLNEYKCDRLHCFIFKDRKVRLGLIAGQIGDIISSPFSAPFGGFSALDHKIQIPYIEESVDLLEKFCCETGIKRIEITLPPFFYGATILTKVNHVLYRKKWSLDQLDLNYFIKLKADLRSMMTYSARKNLKKSFDSAFSFESGESDDDLEKAYEIIRINRELKGYPLRMTLKQVMDTSRIVNVDSFLVKLDGIAIASAIVYHVTDKIPQVVYWGDDVEYSDLRTMNFLTYHLFEYYLKKGFGLIDVGTAMIDNIPNYGLCEFKESIGCEAFPRSCFTREL